MKKYSKSTAIILSVVVMVVMVVGAILSFVRLPFEKFTYVSTINTVNVSTDMMGGLYGEYNIKTENPSEKDIVDTLALVREVFEESGYKNVNVYAVGSSKVRVELSYPTGDETFSVAYSNLSSIGQGAFSLRSTSSLSDTSVVLDGAKFVKDIKIITNNGTQALQIYFTKEGEAKYEELCKKANGTIYLVLGEYSQGITVSGVSDYSALSLSTSDWDNLVSLEQKVKLGCTKVALDGANASINTMSSTLSYGEASSTPTDSSYFSSSLFVVAMSAFLVVAVLLLAFFVVKFGFFALVVALSMLFNSYLYLFITCLVPSFELGLSTVLSLAIGTALIYLYAYDFARNVKSEYNLGKSLAASLESSFKKSLVSVIICGVTLLLASLVLVALSFSELASVAISFAIMSVLILFTNLCFIPFLVRIGISFNGFDRKLFMLKKKRSLSELTDSNSQKEED